MIDTGPELIELGKTLEQRFQMHLHTSTGHIYGYAIHEIATGRLVAHKSKWSPKQRKGKPEQKVRVVFTMGDAEFETADAFLLAYRQKLRDEEFDAAEPKEKIA